MKSTVFILTIIIVSLFACKKEQRYAEDPKNSYKTPQERLSGSWKLSGYTFNDQDIIDSLNKKAFGVFNLNGAAFGYMHITKNDPDYADGDKLIMYASKIPQYRVFDDGTYFKLTCDTITKQDSLFSYWFVNPMQDTIFNSVANWEVTELYKNDFHVVLSTDSGQFKMTFKKQD